MNSFQPLDWAVVGFYFLILIGIVWWAVRQKQESTADYFLAGRHVGWFVIGASIFASNIGSEHIVGLAGIAAKSGVVMGHYELHSWLVLLLGWVFVPFYMRSKVFTTPEFLEKRYSPKARWLLSVISLVGYVLTKVSVTVYAGAVVFQTLMGIDFWTGALIVVILTGVYTVLGGSTSRYLHRNASDYSPHCRFSNDHGNRSNQDWRMEQPGFDCWIRSF